jgi:transcriptional regulator with XRE-family HTH domain
MDPGRLGMKLKELRQARGLTQQQLADQAGITQVYLAQLEGSEKNPPIRNPSLRALNSLARELGVRVSDFFEDRSRLCPLCGKAADVGQLPDAFVALVRCTECGTFKAEEMFIFKAHGGRRKRNPERFEELTRLTRRPRSGRDLVTISEENWKTLGQAKA